MERLICRLLLAWLGLLGGMLLSQQFAPRLSYGLMVAVTCGCPVVALLLLWWVMLGLRQTWRRIQVLRRAAKWPWLRRERYATGDDWLKMEH